MAAKQSLDEKLARLRALAEAPLTPEAIEELRAALAGRNNVLAAKAAQVAAKRKIEGLIPDLVSAFGRFLEKPEKTDKGCLAKDAIIVALNELSHDDEGIFLRGIRHVQMEPVYGGRADTAGPLRGKCASALVRIGCREVLFELAALLMDPLPGPRRDAVVALACLPSDPAELLLRMKVMAGDEDPDVLAEAFEALMSMAPERSLPFIARFLDAKDRATAQSAALALGRSRQAKAFEVLRDRFDASFETERKSEMLLAIALTRLDEAFDFLVAAIRDEPSSVAAAAVGALQTAGMDERRHAVVREAVLARGNDEVAKAFAEKGRGTVEDR